MYNRYNKDELDELEESGDLYVCPYCDYHGHADEFGETCPSCHEKLDDWDWGDD